MKIPEEESYNALSNKTIRSHIFEYLSNFSNHGIHTLKYGKICGKCENLNRIIREENYI